MTARFYFVCVFSHAGGNVCTEIVFFTPNNRYIFFLNNVIYLYNLIFVSEVNSLRHMNDVSVDWH